MCSGASMIRNGFVMKDMNATARMAELLRRLKVEMNGAVVGGMESRGIVYPLSYGVSVPTIRAVAADFAPDHGLALLLYRQQVRELRLAALTVADPALVTPDTLPFWAAGVVNSEVAEHLGAVLLSRSGAVAAAMRGWLDGGEPLLRHCAVVAALKAMQRGAAVDVPTGEAIALLESRFCDDGRATLQASAELLARLARRDEASRKAVEALCGSWSGCGRAPLRYVAEEVAWRLSV